MLIQFTNGYKVYVSSNTFFQIRQRKIEITSSMMPWSGQSQQSSFKRHLYQVVSSELKQMCTQVKNVGTSRKVQKEISRNTSKHLQCIFNLAMMARTHRSTPRQFRAARGQRCFSAQQAALRAAGEARFSRKSRCCGESQDFGTSGHLRRPALGRAPAQKCFAPFKIKLEYSPRTSIVARANNISRLVLRHNVFC